MAYYNTINTFKLFEDKIKDSCILVYTDASKTKERVGFGIYIPQADFRFSARLHDNTNICEAETIIGIHQAMSVSLEKNMSNIITIDFITMLIKQIAYLAYLNEISFTFLWVPCHSNIEGNETANQLAKIGLALNVPLDIRRNKQGFFQELRGEIFQEFYNRWEQDVKVKGKFYSKIQLNTSIIKLLI